MITRINNKRKAPLEDNQILHVLDRGIDDMEARRELPIDEAFQKISELRDNRRNARV